MSKSVFFDCFPTTDSTCSFARVLEPVLFCSARAQSDCFRKRESSQGIHFWTFVNAI